MKALIAALALVCATAPAQAQAQAQAQPQPVTIQVRVSTEGLDMSSDAGARAFLGRLSRAAVKACGGSQPEVSALMVEQARAFQGCRRGALAGAVAQSRSSALQRVFAEQTGQATVLARR